MKKYFEILKKCPLFFGISEEELEGLLHCLGAKVDFYDKRYTVFAEGRPVRHIGIVLSGSVQIEQVDYMGNRSIHSSFGASEMFAEAFAAAELDSIPVSVVAGEPSEIMLIDCSHILYTCERSCGFHRRLIFNLMKDMARKTLVFHRKLDVTSKRTTSEKLIAYLNSESKRVGNRSFDIPYDRQELADYLGVDRSGLSSEISRLTRQGVLASKKRHFTLL